MALQHDARTLPLSYWITLTPDRIYNFLLAAEALNARRGEQCKPVMNAPLLVQKRCIGPSGECGAALLPLHCVPLLKALMNTIGRCGTVSLTTRDVGPSLALQAASPLGNAASTGKEDYNRKAGSHNLYAGLGA